MVEHRTENSGVGGSIPFIGSIQNFILYYILKKLIILNTFYINFINILNLSRKPLLILSQGVLINSVYLIKPKTYFKFFSNLPIKHTLNIYNYRSYKP